MPTLEGRGGVTSADHSVLGAILKKHNHEHSAKHKGVSFKTVHDRQRFLASFFRELRRNTRFANHVEGFSMERRMDVLAQAHLAPAMRRATSSACSIEEDSLLAKARLRQLRSRPSREVHAEEN